MDDLQQRTDSNAKHINCSAWDQVFGLGIMYKIRDAAIIRGLFPARHCCGERTRTAPKHFCICLGTAGERYHMRCAGADGHLWEPYCIGRVFQECPALSTHSSALRYTQ